MANVPDFYLTIIQYAPLIGRGILVTLAIWVITSCISIFIGFMLGIFSCNRISLPISKKCIQLFVSWAKGVPAYVHILLCYFALPALLPFKISAFVAGCFALGCCSAGYMIEIVRTSINMLGNGPWDACFVLGYSAKESLQRIIIPQMLHNSSAIIVGELDQLLKSTSLLATIGVIEITRAGQNIVARELNAAQIYLLIALFYLGISLLLNKLSSRIARRVL